MGKSSLSSVEKQLLYDKYGHNKNTKKRIEKLEKYLKLVHENHKKLKKPNNIDELFKEDFKKLKQKV